MGESWFLHFYLTFTYNVTTNRFFFLPLSFFNLRQLEHLFRFPPPFTFLFIFTTPAATSHLRLMCRSALYSSWVTHLWSALSVPHFSLSAPYKERWLVPETMWPCKDQWEIFLKSNHHLVDDCCCAVCLCVSEISQPMDAVWALSGEMHPRVPTTLSPLRLISVVMWCVILTGTCLSWPVVSLSSLYSSFRSIVKSRLLLCLVSVCEWTSRNMSLLISLGDVTVLSSLCWRKF